jgi:DNA-directed RNA polymerase specialized sigma24 family protein
MTALNIDQLSGPARQMAEHARQTARLRSHQPTLTEWLSALQLDTIDALFDAVCGDNMAATSLLVSEHQDGNKLATAVLMGAKAPMLAAVSRHAPGDTYDERFQVTVDAFLSRALTRAKLGHKYLDAQLYWVTLRTVCNQHEAPVESYELRDDTAGPDVYVDVDEALTAAIVLDWAQNKGLLNDDDRRALDVRFGGKTVLPVREVAARLDVSENGLESRLRRAMGRIRGGVADDAEELTQVCVAALWPAESPEVHAGQRGESSLVA